MPGTHLLPPNLLKLFAPRPPLPYTRPLDRDADRVRAKNVDGVAQLLAQLREDRTRGMMESGAGEGMEEGEEPAFTYAEQTKREMRREERKKKKEDEFIAAKDTCQCLRAPLRQVTHLNLQTNLPTTPRRWETHTKHSSSLVSYVSAYSYLQASAHLY